MQSLSGMRDALLAQHRFVADAAHALRTPLVVLQTQVENLRHKTTAEERAERIADLERGLHRATLLVCQLTSGRAKLPEETQYRSRI
jgi:signal transduction histidine kinase